MNKKEKLIYIAHLIMTATKRLNVKTNNEKVK